MWMIFIIFLISMALIYLLLVLNSKAFWLNKVHEAQSLLYSSSQQQRHKLSNQYHQLTYALGKACFNILPTSAIKQLELQCFSLERPLEKLYIGFGEAIICSTLCLISHFINHNIFLLLFSFLAPALIVLEIKIALAKAHTELEENIEHIVRCLLILIIKTETPIVNALEIIIRDLPNNLTATKKELSKLLETMKKSGVRHTLLEWQTEQAKFKDLIALLISINEGASKHALKLNFDNFLTKMQDSREQELKNKAENVQLYLMGPVLIMLLIISLPMMDAVRFLMTESMKPSL